MKEFRVLDESEQVLFSGDLMDSIAFAKKNPPCRVVRADGEVMMELRVPRRVYKPYYTPLHQDP